MSPISIGLLAVTLSIDAFVASLGKGTGNAQRPDMGRVLKTAAIFGAIAGLAPLVGWALGRLSSTHVAAVDHWIGFGLLGAVGLHMVMQGLGPHDELVQNPRPIWAIVAAAVGTSVDAMAVGVSLAVLQMNIVVCAVAIGTTTMIMSSTGLVMGRYLGRMLGRNFGQIMEVVGGVVLMGLGLVMLLQHL